MREKERSKWQEVGAKGQSRKIAGAREPGVPPGLKGAVEEAGVVEKVEGMWFRHFARLTMGTSAAVLSVMVACAVLRTHLFIWTVFSPKYLYAMAWAVGFHLVVSGAYGAVVWAVGI